jgi:hypothetical protein
MRKSQTFAIEAEKCRRLARAVSDPTTVKVLLQLADEYDESARLAAIEEAQDQAQEPTPEK